MLRKYLLGQTEYIMGDRTKRPGEEGCVGPLCRKMSVFIWLALIGYQIKQ